MFTTRIDAVFVVPKLAVLWGALAVSLLLVAAGVLRGGLTGLGRERSLIDLGVALFVALSVVAWVFSTDREQSLYGERLQYQGLLTLLLYVGFFYVARRAIRGGLELQALFGAVAIGATLVSGYALVQRAGVDPIWDGYLPGGRVFSSIGQANALAAYLVVALPVSAALVFTTRGTLRAAVLIAVSAMLAALGLTQSRGGFLGLLAVVAVLAIGWRSVLRPLTRRERHRLAGALVLAAVIAVVGVSAAVLQRFSIDSSLRFHLDAWKVAARVAEENPVLGTGPATFPEVFPRYSHAVLPEYRASELDAFRVESPHNVYLDIASGSGLPALVAYLALIAGFIVVTIRAARRAASALALGLVAVLAALTGHLVTDAFMTADVTSTWLFWVLMGAALLHVSPHRRTQLGAGRIEQGAPAGGAPVASGWSRGEGIRDSSSRSTRYAGCMADARVRNMSTASVATTSPRNAMRIPLDKDPPPWRRVG